MTDQLLNELLDIARQISRGEIPPYQHNECYTSGAFDLLLVHAKGVVAFELLTRACARYQAIVEANAGLTGYYDLLSILARRTDTTEKPDGMHQIIQDHPDLSGDLREWYRYGG